MILTGNRDALEPDPRFDPRPRRAAERRPRGASGRAKARSLLVLNALGDALLGTADRRCARPSARHRARARRRAAARAARGTITRVARAAGAGSRACRPGCTAPTVNQLDRRARPRHRHRRRRRRSQRHRHLLPGRRAVRLRPAVDDAAHLSADVGGAAGQRAHRAGHGRRPRAAISAGCSRKRSSAS